MYKPSGFSETIFKDRYAFTEEEPWEGENGACMRLAKQMASAESHDKYQKYVEKFYNMLVSNQFVAGGRIWYNSGRPNPQLLNCISGDTIVHIKGGVELAKNLVGKEVETLSIDGLYRKATWKSYGKQPLMEIVLENGDILEATPSHEWIVQAPGGSSTAVLPTIHLQGKKIPFEYPRNVQIDPVEFRKGIHHGMVYGDGSVRTRKGGSKYTEVRQFGDINTQVLFDWFDKDNIRSYNDKRYGTVFYATRLPGHYKELPSKEESQSYLQGFIAGFIATDGHVNRHGGALIFQSNKEVLESVRKLAAKAGLPTLGVKMYREKCPFSDEYRPNYKITFVKEVISSNKHLILKQSHKPAQINERTRRKWMKVRSVNYTSRFEEVYCCEEPETHTMVIGNGYLTKQCFVLGNNLDSKEGWGRILYENTVTSMCGGGCGQDFSSVRPRGSEIVGHRGTCPGPVELMKGVNCGAHMVRAGGGRRAANMFSLDLRHPDIPEFLDAKLVKGELDMANVSVNSFETSKFIEAVKNNDYWEFSWKNKYKKKIKARTLWNKIVKNAYDCAEPGFLNMELALSESTVYYIEDLVTTNPCGEIFLTAYESCDLGHLVLPRFVVNGEVDWHSLAIITGLGVRFLDNVLSVNSYPLPEMKDKAQRLRRIGLGTTGLADMLAMLGYKYGSKKGNEFVDHLYRFISKAAYEASVMLAVEKGAFPDCNPELHVKSGYMKRMTKKVRSLVEEHGIRNCAILTQAPTGTVSILSNNCSSGIEPMFAFAYWRNYWDNEERKRELCFHPLFVEFMRNKKGVSHFVASHDLSVKDHMEVQKIVQKHMDNAVSKTINIPRKYPIKKINELWLQYLPFLKGTTFYREGSRNYVDQNGVEQEPPLVPIELKEAIKLYKEQGDSTEEAAHTDDCATGICDI